MLGMLDKSFKEEYIRKEGTDIRNLVVLKFYDPDIVIWINSR
jgi:hypothetical protein